MCQSRPLPRSLPPIPAPPRPAAASPPPQWWEFKSRHFDAVLLFKMGKFYELFEMDAHLAVEVLGLSYMKASKRPAAHA